MCLAKRDLTPKARRFLAIGNLCLVSGLVMSIFDKDLGLHHAALYDGLRGFFFGMSITFNLCAMRIARNSGL